MRPVCLWAVPMSQVDSCSIFDGSPLSFSLSILRLAAWVGEVQLNAHSLTEEPKVRLDFFRFVVQATSEFSGVVKL